MATKKKNSMLKNAALCAGSYAVGYMATSFIRDVALASKMCSMEDTAPKKGCSVEEQLALKHKSYNSEKYGNMANSTGLRPYL